MYQLEHCLENNTRYKVLTAFYVDFENCTIEQIGTTFSLDASSYKNFKVLGVTNNQIYMRIDGKSDFSIYTSINDYTEVIALAYQGEYYYKRRHGLLTAGQPDVRKGKTFIGWQGYPEVGTMEVT